MSEVLDRPIAGQQDFDGGVAPPPPLDEIIVEGTVELGHFNAGGKRPTVGVLRFGVPKIRLLEGTAFLKGDTLVFEIVAVVAEVSQKDKFDKPTGQVVSCEQIHGARVTDMRIVTDDE